jgi:hypothetical protein
MRFNYNALYSVGDGQTIGLTYRIRRAYCSNEKIGRRFFWQNWIPRLVRLEANGSKFIFILKYRKIKYFLFSKKLLYLYSCCSHLEHRASVKRFVSLQFLNLRQSVGFLGRWISPSQGRCLHMTTQTQNKRRQTSMSCMGFEYNPSVCASEGISCLILRGHCDQLSKKQYWKKKYLFIMSSCSLKNGLNNSELRIINFKNLAPNSASFHSSFLKNNRPTSFSDYFWISVSSKWRFSPVIIHR